MTTPLLCGTLVNGEPEGLLGADRKRITNLTFDRKLRMMRADVFALLGISTDSNFFSEPPPSLFIQQAVRKFLEGEFNDRVNNI